MDVNCVFLLHSGGMLSEPPFRISVMVARTALTAGRRVPCSTLAHVCCDHLSNTNRLEVHNMQFAEVNGDGWEPRGEDEVELPKDDEQQELVLNVMVVPTAVGPGFQPQSMHEGAPRQM